MSEKRWDDKRAIFADSNIPVQFPLPSRNGGWGEGEE
jgi:hypothetical protein